jgi:hypothetical protein
MPIVMPSMVSEVRILFRASAEEETRSMDFNCNDFVPDHQFRRNRGAARYEMHERLRAVSGSGWDQDDLRLTRRDTRTRLSGEEQAQNGNSA